MKVVGNCEYGLVLYKDKLPKFNNNGRMVFNCFDWIRDNQTPKIHPTQKPIQLLKQLIELFTDKNDVVIDPTAGSGTTLRAAFECGRNSFGFEIKKDFYKKATEIMLKNMQLTLDLQQYSAEKMDNKYSFYFKIQNFNKISFQIFGTFLSKNQKYFVTN